MNKILEEEKAYLEYVKDKLSKEIEKNQKDLIEIPQTYNKAIQGDTFLVEDLMSMTLTKLKKLESATKSPYFGRIDFLSDGSNNAIKIYIGKTTITDEDNKQVTTDWRAPICSLYYDSELGQASYIAPSGLQTGKLQLKRQIVIKDGELVDALDTSLVTTDELLQPYLSVTADNRMKTIIASIQKEQNQIIRRPITKNIIVQGVAGSGKTSVALHRIAYLVYTLGEKITSNQILAIGPNKYFLDYVSSILPELETEPVDQKTYLDLVNDILKSKYTLDSQEIFDQKGNIKELKKIQAFKSSLAYKEAISRFISDFFQNGIVDQGIIIDGVEIYSKEVIASYLFPNKNSYPNYEVACKCILQHWQAHVEDIYDKLNEKYRNIYINLPKGDPKRAEAVAKSTELSNLIRNNGQKIIKDYFKKLELKPIDIYQRFIDNIDKYAESLTEEEIQELKSVTTASLKKKKLSFEDMPALLYINYLLHGNKNTYKHIVIDEAQDYGMFHIDILKTLFPKSTFSIYGDLGQSIYYHRGIDSWENVAENIFNNDCEILNLNKSYRTTIEITNVANNILDQMQLQEADPVVRHGEKIIFSDLSKDDSYKAERIMELASKGYKTIAIICKTDKEANNVFKKLSSQGLNITQITSKSSIYEGGVFVLTSALAKGLEFDAVIINDASNNIYDNLSATDMHLLYVACTRALHELEILYNKKICNVFKNNVEVLETQKTRVRKK